MHEPFSEILQAEGRTPTDTYRLSHQLGRFLLLGLVSALMDVGLLTALVEWAQWHYLAATAISFLCANTFNYGISRNWVFVAGRFRRGFEYTGFLVTSALGLSIHQVVMLLLVDEGHFDYRLSKMICISIVASWNFITRKYLVFTR